MDNPVQDNAVTGRANRPIGALRFALKFLVLTGLFLALSRYTVNTTPVNWYLFQVASQTAWVLRWFGEATWLENPVARRSQAAEMRAVLHDETPPYLGGRVAPVTAYESWRFRALQRRRDLEATRAAMALTQAPPRPAFASDREHLAYIRQMLDRVEESTRREGVRGPVLPAAPEVRELLDRSREVVEALEGGQQPATMGLSEALDQLEAQVDRTRKMHRAYLDRRLAEQKAHIQNHLGPTVTYVARAIRPQTRREALENELVNAASNSSLDEPQRKQRIDALQAELGRVKSAANPSTGDEAAEEHRFSFNVVPDCGALPLMAIFLAAIVAFPVSWKKRFAGLLFGLPTLYVINIARLTCLALIGSRTGGGEWFEFAHEYVWQALYIIIVVVLWLLWVEVIVKGNRLWRTAPS